MDIKEKIILLVEDDQGIRDALAELLRMEGYQVLSATNGCEALRILSSNEHPGLILLDLMMPIMDGFRFREIQLESPKIADIPVMIMSADGNVGVKKAATRAKEYIKKPVDIDDLLERVSVCFAG